MPLTKLQFRSGINREVTSYSNEGGWFDCDKVRFRYGFPEKIGGWLRLSATTFLGTCRALLPWVALDGSRYIGVGTHLKYYINEGGGYTDITPIRTTTSAGAVTFSAVSNTLRESMTAIQNSVPLTSVIGFPGSGLVQIGTEQIRYASISGNDLIGITRGVNSTTVSSHLSGSAVNCATLIVSDTNHGALDQDFVTFSGATGLGSQITADALNQEYQIVSIVSPDAYLIEARVPSTISSITTTSGLEPTPVFADSGDTGNGGANVAGTYQVNTGLDTTVIGTGWGAGAWGRNTWGSSANLLISGIRLRIWSHDNFGEDLLFNVRDGDIFIWDKSNGLANRGVALSTLAGANRTPTIAKQIMVSDRDRHVLAFGCDDEFAPGVQDPLLIRFSDRENLTDWGSTATNTAGSLRLGSGSEIIAALETRQQILIFTDVSLHAMQFLGQPFTFGIQLISENITVAGPLSTMAVDDLVFWMGLSEFYIYDGTVRRLPCSVRDFVFDDMNRDQMEKITAGLNSENGEIWWFYPSSGSEENDRYVIYNYLEQVWYYGTLPRTCWVDRGIENFPISASPDHHLYNHEIGFNDGSTSPSSAITAFVESSPIDIGDGQQFTFIRRMIPDINFLNSTEPNPQLSITTRVRNYTSTGYLRTTTSPVIPSTEQVHLRLRGRQMGVRVESSEVDVTWRLGSMRYDIQPDGLR